MGLKAAMIADAEGLVGALGDGWLADPETGVDGVLVGDLDVVSGPGPADPEALRFESPAEALRTW